MKSIKSACKLFLKMDGIYLISFVFGSCKKAGNTPPHDMIPNVSINSLKILASNIPTAMNNDLAFVNFTTGFSIYQGQIIKTSNGGYNWTSALRHFIFNS